MRGKKIGEVPSETVASLLDDESFINNCKIQGACVNWARALNVSL